MAPFAALAIVGMSFRNPRPAGLGGRGTKPGGGGGMCADCAVAIRGAQRIRIQSAMTRWLARSGIKLLTLSSGGKLRANCLSVGHSNSGSSSRFLRQNIESHARSASRIGRGINAQHVSELHHTRCRSRLRCNNRAAVGQRVFAPFATSNRHAHLRHLAYVWIGIPRMHMKRVSLRACVPDSQNVHTVVHHCVIVFLKIVRCGRDDGMRRYHISWPTIIVKRWLLSSRTSCDDN